MKAIVMPRLNCMTLSRLPYKAFLIFLKSVIKIATQLNVLFQSVNIEPTKLYEDLFLMFKSLFQKIPAQLQKIRDSELATFNFTTHLMHPSSISFSHEFQCVAEYLNPTDLKDFKERFKNLRLPENLRILKMMANLHPKVATSQAKSSLNNVPKSLDRTALYGNKDDDEWNKLQNKS